MERLEKTLNQVLVSPEESADKQDQNNSYKGLKLVEDKMYEGPTSIKYWM